MFSRRLEWPAPRNRLAGLLRDMRGRGAAILDLTESNPTRVGLDYPRDAIVAALADPAALSYDPEPRGMPAAREAVAAYYARRGLPVAPGRIFLTASTSEAYALLFKLLADPGDRILVPRPSYPLFDYLAALESVRVACYPIQEDAAWAIDTGVLEEEALGGRAGGDDAAPPRAVVVVSPNNPTGSAIRETERSRLEEICGRRGMAIISDEVFTDYLYGGDGAPAGPVPDGRGAIVSMLSPRTPAAGARPLVFTLGGLAKSCGLPQLKLGWIVVDGPDEVAEEAVDRLELIADTYLSVGTPVQAAAPRLLELGEGIGRAIRARVIGNRRALAGLIGPETGCRLLPADGGWSAIVRVPAVLPEEDLVLRLLEKDGTLVHPGYFFDFPREAYLVLSLLPNPDRFHEGVRRTLARIVHP
jgi:alanine-synthesizing transaminase